MFGCGHGFTWWSSTLMTGSFVRGILEHRKFIFWSNPFNKWYVHTEIGQWMTPWMGNRELILNNRGSSPLSAALEPGVVFLLTSDPSHHPFPRCFFILKLPLTTNDGVVTVYQCHNCHILRRQWRMKFGELLICETIWLFSLSARRFFNGYTIYRDAGGRLYYCRTNSNWNLIFSMVYYSHKWNY